MFNVTVNCNIVSNKKKNYEQPFDKSSKKLYNSQVGKMPKNNKKDKRRETNYEKSIEKWKFFKKFSIEKRSTLITVFSQFLKNGWIHWKINI